MSNWDSNSWQLYRDNINQVLIKDNIENIFDLESFSDPDDESTLWRLTYVAHDRPMLDFWYGMVFREAGEVPPKLALPGGPLANYSNANANAWMAVGDMVQALVDGDDGSLERLETLVSLKGITYKLALYRIGGVLQSSGELLYVRLRKIYAPQSAVVQAPDGGGIGRGK
jgi:hypothetical protein